MQKRSISIHGHRTSLLLEPVFWTQLENIARERDVSLPVLIAQIDRARTRETAMTDRPQSLASSLRVFVVEALASAQATVA